MRIKPILVSVLLILNMFNAVAQFSVKIVNENFNSNMMQWNVQSNELSAMELANGKYTISCSKEGTAITSVIEVPHLQFTNYRISASLSKLKGIDDNGFGLVWGSKDENNELEYVISGNGQFKVMKWEQGIKTDIVGWTYSSAINKWDFSKNELKIESFDNVLRFYINGTYVVATKDLAHLGNKAGFVLNEKMQVEIDYLVIENLTNAVSENLGSANNASISQISYSGAKVNEIYYNESGSINIELANNSNLPVRDLAIIVKVPEQTSGLEFNSITMVDEIAGNEHKTIAIKLSANEEVPTQSNNFNVQLISYTNEIVDSKNISIRSVGLSSYYSKDQNDPNNPIYPDNTTTKPEYNKEKYNNNNSSDACAKGCSGIGLLTLITALIIAIL